MQGSTTLHPGPKPQHILVEEKVAEWIRDKRGEGKRISRLVVLRTFLQLNPAMFGGKSAVGFIVKMNRLFYAFLKRHGLSIRAITSVGQKLPVGWETKWDEFEARMLECRRLEPGDLIPPSCVWNMDQTPVYIEEVGKTTVNVKGEKSAAVRTAGKEKERVTVQLTVNAMGGKLPPDAIFKGLEAPKRVDKRTITYQIMPENREAFGYPSRSLISLQVNPKGYSNESVMKKWVNESFRFRCGRGLAEQQKKSVLILDDFKPQPIKLACSSLNTRLALIPGGLTPKCQILDRVPNKLFKGNMRDKWDQHMLMTDVNAAGKLPIPPRNLVARWVVQYRREQHEQWTTTMPPVLALSLTLFALTYQSQNLLVVRTARKLPSNSKTLRMTILKSVK